jgi:hypothetical protein
MPIVMPDSSETTAVVKNTFMHFAQTQADYFDESPAEGLIPPRLFGRRARTPDPIRQPMDIDDDTGKVHKVTSGSALAESDVSTALDVPSQKLTSVDSNPTPDEWDSPLDVNWQWEALPGLPLNPRAFSDTSMLMPFLPPNLIQGAIATPSLFATGLRRMSGTSTDTTPTSMAVDSPTQRDHRNVSVRNTFVHISPDKQDFFSATDNDELFPPRLHGRRARTPDPQRTFQADAEDSKPLGLAGKDHGVAQLPEQKQTSQDEDDATTAKRDKKKKKKKSDVDFVSQLSPEKKKALANEVYDEMIRKKFDNPDGYLLIDVYVEIFRDLVGEQGNRSTALHRFASLLRSFPDLFEIFNLGIKVTNHAGRFARKGEKMVKIITPGNSAEGAP